MSHYKPRKEDEELKNDMKKNPYGNFNLGKTEAPKSNTTQDKPKATVTKGNDLRIGKK